MPPHVTDPPRSLALSWLSLLAMAGHVTAQAPAISAQPAGMAVSKGTPVVLTVVGTGNPAPSFQWHRNGNAIPGATAATLTLPAVTLPDDGSYFVRLTNVHGTVDSNAATVSVLYPGEGLRHRYSFTGNLNDSVGTAHAQLWSGTTQVASPTVGASSLTFTQASSHHLRLPPAGAGSAGLNVNTYTQMTVEMWCSIAEHSGKLKLWEFGNCTDLTTTTATAATDYLYFCPRSTNTGSAATTLGMTDNSATAERIITRAGRFTNVTNAHIVCVFDPVTGTESLYLNGALSASSNSFAAGALPKLSEIGTQYAFIGRALLNSSGQGSGSNFGFLNGSVDELRIYRCALRPQDVAAHLAAGPNSTPAVPATISFAQHPQPVTVTEPAAATFSVDVNGPKPLSVQWYKNGSAIPGATTTVLLLPTVPADNGSTIFCKAASGALTLDSNTVTLTVNADNTPPAIAYIYTSGLSTVIVGFTEPVTVATAANAANYTLSPPSSVTSAVLSGDGRSVTLSLGDPLISGIPYSLGVANVRDTSFAANVIAPGTARTFTAVPFVVTGIGTPAVAPSADSTNVFSLTSSGSLPQATADNYGMATEAKNGDFDVKVNVAGLGLTDLWARAGLIARNGTAPGDLMAAAVATPGPAGCFFQSRSTANAAPVNAGAFPMNFPANWLRLRRAGNAFTGFTSLDGNVWTQLGSASVAMGSTVQVGVFTSSATGTATTAHFSGYGNVLAPVLNTQPLPVEPDGPSSRRSPVTITEVFYNPNAANGAGDLEFIEIHNTAGWSEDLSGWTLKGGVNYTLPPGTMVTPGAYLVIAANPADFQARYGTTPLGPWLGSLNNNGDALRLENEVGGTIAEVDYNDEAPWPVAAAGLGHSLVLAKPSYGESDARAWLPSALFGGSPGARDPWVADPAQSVRISEFLANSEAPVLDFVELFNASSSPVDIGGMCLGDGALLDNAFVIPSPTIIPARGYVSFTETQMGFSLGSDGERLWLCRPSARIVDAISYSGQDVNVSRDRDLQELATPTPGAANSGAKVRPVIINEIMYNPIGGSDGEYIELLNRTASPVDVGGWRIGGGVDFTFAPGSVIAANGFLVVAKNQPALLAKGYAALTAANTRGNYSGSLGNGGDRVTLRIPVAFNSPLGAGTAYATIDEVVYENGGRWGRWADGGGSSLELRDARADNRLADNWGDSDESAKAPWTNLTVTMLHDYRMPNPTSGTAHNAANRIEFFLQGAGEVLVDDLSITNAANTQFVTNGGFENGLGTGAFAWTGQGDQKQISLLTTGAAGGTNCLRLIASDRGDTGANRVRNALSSDGTTVATLTDGATYTLSAKARWVRGSRYFHVRTRGNSLELAGVLAVPATPGTPGAPNSIAANAGPAISDVSHWPILPAANEAVTVTARISDPDGVASVNLLVRNDVSSVVNTVPMNDSGTVPDAFAGDGIWSGTIPGLAANSAQAWRIQAGDGTSTATFPGIDPLIFPATLQERECLVRFGEAAQFGGIGSYRLWLKQATITEWNNREKNSNQPLPATFVLGNYRAFYNVYSLYSGSPWHTGQFSGPTGTGTGTNQCDYEIIFNEDDRLLGATDFITQSQGSSSTALDEFTSFWISRKLGLFAPSRRPVHMFVNGTRKSTIFEDAEQPSGESVRQYQRSESDGTLYKIEDWFEFDDAGSAQNYQNANLPPTSTTVNGVSGVKKTARYRWNWRVRSQADPNTYAPIFTLADLVNAPNDASFIPNLDAQVDLYNWMGTIMAHHLVGNKDAYGSERGKNAYAFKAANGRWTQYIFDMDFSLAAAQDTATTNLFVVNPDPNSSKDGQPETAKLFGIPATKRICWNVLREAATGPLAGPAVNAMIDQRYADFLCNGVSPAAPTATKQYIADRRNYILSQLPTAAFGVTGSAPSGSDPSILVVNGTSPVSVLQIVVNGLVWPVTWNSDTTWTLRYQMVSGANVLSITGIDRRGLTVATAPPVNANYTGTTAWPALRINEWMSENDSFAADPADGGFDDWFELHNATAQPVNLSGWYLSDDPAVPAKFLIPSGFSIPAGGFLRVWADNAPVQTSAGQLHVNFRLSNSGEALVLSALDRTLVDSVTFGPQKANESAGRYPDSAAGIFDLTLPTPASANVLTRWETTSLTPAGFEMRFSTTPGRTYRILESTNLATWNLFGTDLTASGVTATVTDPAGAALPGKFYRVETVP